MKVLHVIQRFGGGGRERRMVQLVRELSKKADVEQAALIYPSEVQYQEINGSEIKIYTHSESSHLKRFLEIKDVVKKYKPDIVHSWSDTPLELITLPILSRTMGYRYIAGFVADGNKVSNLSFRGLATRFSFLKADAIVSNSQSGIKAKNAPQAKSHVIYNGFDFNRIKANVDKGAKKKELGITEKFVVSMVARVTEAKDWQSFIEVAKRAYEDNLDVCFLAIGEGNQLDLYRDIVKQTGLQNIRFVGRRSDVEEILQITDVSMLFTSEVHLEGVSNSIMEAMATGIPVIATDGGGTPEIITDGQNGFIVPLHGVDKAYQLLKDLLLDNVKRSMIGSTAKLTVQQNFLLSHMGDEYMRLYRELLG
ncbi:MAG: glycosyltransferase family 4 protein [Bacteroidales bacterium]|nr:glycosyltransferase family 4 protein [Bacteroidales bacterium]